MSALDAVTRLYLPLLTQEAAVMVSAFTYGLRVGASPWLLLLTNAAAIGTDLLLFYVPLYAVSPRMRGTVSPSLQRAYDRSTSLADRFGAFRTAVVASFILPSVSSMVVLGLIRPPFKRTLLGIIVGSGAYAFIPLAVAAPLASVVPRWIIPWLPWIAPILALFYLGVALLRFRPVSEDHSPS